MRCKRGDPPRATAITLGGLFSPPATFRDSTDRRPAGGLVPSLSQRQFLALRSNRQFSSQAGLFGEFRPCRGIVWRDHWIGGRQSPALAVVFWRQSEGQLQVPLERFELLPVFQTYNVVCENGLLNRHSGLRSAALSTIYAPDAAPSLSTRSSPRLSAAATT
jgi:hypothetical protein